MDCLEGKKKEEKKEERAFCFGKDEGGEKRGREKKRKKEEMRKKGRRGESCTPSMQVNLNQLKKQKDCHFCFEEAQVVGELKEKKIVFLLSFLLSLPLQKSCDSC